MSTSLTAREVHPETPDFRIVSESRGMLALWDGIFGGLALLAPGLWLTSSHPNHQLWEVALSFAGLGAFCYVMMRVQTWKVEATPRGIRVWSCAFTSRTVPWGEIASVFTSSYQMSDQLSFRLKGRSVWRSIRIQSKNCDGYDAGLAAIAAHCQQLGIPIKGSQKDELEAAIDLYAPRSEDAHSDAPWSADIPAVSLLPILALSLPGTVFCLIAAIALAPPDARLMIAAAIVGFEALCFTTIVWSVRNQAMSGTITRDTITAKPLFRAPVVVPWADVTRVRKGSSSVTIWRRGGGRITISLRDAGLRELVLQQISARAIPTT
jgi:hypothetical protein